MFSGVCLVWFSFFHLPPLLQNGMCVFMGRLMDLGSWAGADRRCPAVGQTGPVVPLSPSPGHSEYAALRPLHTGLRVLLRIWTWHHLCVSLPLSCPSVPGSQATSRFQCLGPRGGAEAGAQGTSASMHNPGAHLTSSANVS